jgi:nitrogen fixation protein FixH
MSTTTKPRFNPWPIGVVAAIVLMMMTILTMVFIAVRNAPVLVDRGDYYERSVAYQGEIDARKAASALGYSAEIQPSSAAVELRLRDASGHPVTGRTGGATFARADTEAHDFQAPLVEVAPGRYRAARAHAVPGRYALTARLDDPAGGPPWLAEAAVFLP